MGKTIKGKDAAKAKKDALKTRLKKLKGKEAYASACAVVAALLAVVGCSTATPASRYTAATYGDITINGSNNRVTIGDGAFAQADSSGTTETQSATPTNTTDIKPDVDVNTTGGRTAGVLETAISAGASLLKGGNSGSCSDGSCDPSGTDTCSDCSM